MTVFSAPFSFTRRAALAFAVLAITVAAAPSARADIGGKEEQAKMFVQKVGEHFIDVLGDDKTATAAKKPVFTDMIKKYTDYRWMAGFVAGRAAKGAEDTQKEAFFELYPEYLVKTYLPKYGNFKSRAQTVKDVQADKQGYLVITEISNEDRAPIDLRYRVRFNDAGEPVIFDILAEGVSLILTQRSEFDSFIRKNGFEAFVGKLKSYVNS